MDVVRLLHFADLHLGVEAGGRPSPMDALNQRIHDVLDRLDEVCACVEDEAVDAVLFAGDAFKHQHPTPTLQKLLAQRIRRMARTGAAVFLLVGNHDLPKMAALAHPFSIYDALEVEGVVVGEKAKIYHLPLRGGRTLQVGALPHFSRQHVLARLGELVPEDVDEKIRQSIHDAVGALGDAVDPAHPAVFAGHCHVNQAAVSKNAQSFFGEADMQIPLSSLASSEAFQYYGLGHVHKMQVLQTEPYVAYSGSLERVDYSEGESVRIVNGGVRREAAEEKGFYRIELERAAGGWRLADTPTFRTVDARRFVTIRTDDSLGQDPTSGIVSAIETARSVGSVLDGAFVKLVAALDAADRGRLSFAAVRDAVPEAYEVRLAVEVRDDATRLRDPRFATAMTESEALERYLETRQDWADDRRELLRMGRALIAELTG